MTTDIVLNHLHNMKIKFTLIEGQPWMNKFSDLLNEYNINDRQVLRAVMFQDKYETRKMLITSVGSAVDYNQIINDFITSNHEIVQDGEYYNFNLKTALPIPQYWGVKYKSDIQIYQGDHIYIPTQNHSVCKISS